MEKRKHPRYKACTSIKYRRSDDPFSSWQTGSEIKNISMGGLLFTAYENMPAGTPLIFKLHIFTKDLMAKIIELKASVVEAEDGIMSYDTRVIFVDLSGSQKALLKQFIDYIEP